MKPTRTSTPCSDACGRVLDAWTNANVNKPAGSQIGTARIDTNASGKQAIPAAPKRTGRAIATPNRATTPGAANTKTRANVGKGPSARRSPIGPFVARKNPSPTANATSARAPTTASIVPDARSWSALLPENPSHWIIHTYELGARVGFSRAFGHASRRLVQAAWDCVRASGMDGATSRAITTAAEANLGAITYHFGSKEALLGEAVGQAIEALVRPALDALQDETLDPVSRVLNAITQTPTHV